MHLRLLQFGRRVGINTVLGRGGLQCCDLGLCQAAHINAVLLRVSGNVGFLQFRASAHIGPVARCVGCNISSVTLRLGSNVGRILLRCRLGIDSVLCASGLHVGPVLGSRGLRVHAVLAGRSTNIRLVSVRFRADVGRLDRCIGSEVCRRHLIRLARIELAGCVGVVGVLERNLIGLIDVVSCSLGVGRCIRRGDRHRRIVGRRVCRSHRHAGIEHAAAVGLLLGSRTGLLDQRAIRINELLDLAGNRLVLVNVPGLWCGALRCRVAGRRSLCRLNESCCHSLILCLSAQLRAGFLMPH